MRTDTIFFQLFQTFDSLLFELVGLAPEAAIGYQFTSEDESLNFGLILRRRTYANEHYFDSTGNQLKNY
jgi:hypothetical protein